MISAAQFFRMEDILVIHQLIGHYVVSAYGVWLPGAYESERAARFAFRFSSEELQALQESANLRTQGRGGIIAWSDLNAYSVKKRMARCNS